ncbi:MAG: AAA family ATPase [Candidatus Gracilibacteria bacterium]|jgi:ABC-type cobalamin/Fe3+-siderophores transport system ATPase subunit
MTTIIKYGDSENERIEFNTKNASIIGGNGSGKSSLMRKIKLQNSSFTIISAHKNLTIKQGIYKGNEDNWLTQNKSHYKSPTTGDTSVPADNNSVQDDFNQMIEIIFRDYNNESVEALNAGKTLSEITRKLDKIVSVWNSIFTDKILLYKDKKIKVQVAGEETFYDIENLSDGERTALYVLIKLVLADSSPTIVIDEPETFLNPAILNQLFDECEKINSGSNFIYFSHDLEFVTTRKDNTIFWIKEYKHPHTWKILPTDPADIPEELIVKVVGAKKQKILFVESANNKDAQLYQLLYPDFKIWAVGGCENVINYTKAFNSRTEKFNKEYFGLIDRDLKSDVQVATLVSDKIFCLPVAVYENLFLNKEIIKFVFTYLGKTDFDVKFAELETEVKGKVLDDNFKLGYKKSKVQQLFNQEMEAIAKGERQFVPDLSVYEVEIVTLGADTYENILRSFNQKNLKGCVAKLNTNWFDWQNQVLNIFNTDKSDEFRTEFLKFMPEIK